MRTYARAVVLTAVTALAVGGLAAPALAASPVLSSADPAPNMSLDVDPSGVTLTFDQELTTVSTIDVTGPSGNCVKTSPVVLPSDELACGFVPGDLLDGTYTVTYSADPSSGSDPATTGSYEFFLDSVAPAAPTAVAIAPDPYNATSTTLTVTGTSEGEDDTVEVVVTSGAATISQDVDAGAGGGFTATFTAGEVGGLPDGTLTATARSTDAASNEGPAAGTTAIKDTVSPAEPTGVAIAPDPYTGTSTTLTVTGTSEDDDDTVEVLVSSGAVTLSETVHAGPGGDFTASFTGSEVAGLPDGTLAATARSTDVAGNEGPAASATATKDTGTPAAPTVSTLPVFANQANSSEFPVSGTGEPGASVAVTLTRVSASVTKNVTVSVGGSWSTTVDVTGLSDGTLTVTATQTDIAGNTSPTSAPLTTTKDTGAPVAPAVNALPPFANQDNSAEFPVSGTGEPGASVVVTVIGASASVTKNVTVSVGGSWSTTVNVSGLSDGTATVTATQTDVAGNTGPTSEPLTTTKDTVAPAAPNTVLISPDPINAANQAAVTVSGQSEGARVRITVSRGANSLTQTVDVSGGGYSTVFDVSSLADGGIAALVVALDAAGNISDPEVDQTLKDTVAPTKDSSLPVEGSRVLPPATVVMTFSESLASGSITIPGVPGTSSRSGLTVTFTPTATMPEGTLTATAAVTDLRGNPGSGTVSFVVDDGFATTSTTLDPLPSAVSYQKAIKLSGQVTRPDKSVAALPVMVSMRDEAGRTSEIALVTPSASGAWSFLYRPTVNGTFSATYLGDAKNAASTSGDRTTKVRVGIAASTTTGPAARKATVRGSVTPAKVGAVVKLFRVGKGGTKLLGKAKVKAGGRFTFKVRLPKGRTKLQVSIGVTPGNLGGSARLTAFRT